MKVIKASEEISKVFTEGKRFKTPYITFIYAPSNIQHGPAGRVAFIAGKKNGNAVWRNSAKRRMREICRALGGPWESWDVLFVAKPSITRDSYSKVLGTCESAADKFSMREGTARQ